MTSRPESLFRGQKSEWSRVFSEFAYNRVCPFLTITVPGLGNLWEPSGQFANEWKGLVHHAQTHFDPSRIPEGHHHRGCILGPGRLRGTGAAPASGEDTSAEMAPVDIDVWTGWTEGAADQD